MLRQIYTTLKDSSYVFHKETCNLRPKICLTCWKIISANDKGHNKCKKTYDLGKMDIVTHDSFVAMCSSNKRTKSAPDSDLIEDRYVKLLEISDCFIKIGALIYPPFRYSEEIV